MQFSQMTGLGHNTIKKFVNMPKMRSKTFAARLAGVVALVFFLIPRAVYPQEIFRGESCARCHTKIRDQVPQLPSKPDTPDDNGETLDVIVVGGGLSGLTAAYHLRKSNLLLLEQESRVGGKARREFWGEARYPVAASYMAEVYLDVVKEMFRDLGIHGKKIPEPRNSFHVSQLRKIVGDPFGKGLPELPQSEEAKQKIRKFRQDMAELSQGPQMGDVPPVPEPLQITSLQRSLDQQNFFAYIGKHYGPSLADFADRYSLSLFGTRAKDVSAWAGLVFLSADFGDSPNITWDGGPGVISEKLAQRISPERIETGALVTKVSQDSIGVQVEYWKYNKRNLRRAKAVVMAVPSFVAKRIVAGLPRWKVEALSKVRYSSYAIGIIALDKMVYQNSFDVWSDTKSIFTDIEFLPISRYKTPSVDGTPAQILMAFIPLEEHSGRAFMARTSDERLTEAILTDLGKIFPEVRTAVHGIRIIRWGHAMPINYPNYLTRDRADVVKRVGRIFFAGVDTQMPCLEGAIISGYLAAQEVHKALK